MCQCSCEHAAAALQLPTALYVHLFEVMTSDMLVWEMTHQGLLAARLAGSERGNHQSGTASAVGIAALAALRHGVNVSLRQRALQPSVVLLDLRKHAGGVFKSIAVLTLKSSRGSYWARFVTHRIWRTVLMNTCHDSDATETEMRFLSELCCHTPLSGAPLATPPTKRSSRQQHPAAAAAAAPAADAAPRIPAFQILQKMGPVSPAPVCA